MNVAATIQAFAEPLVATTEAFERLREDFS
jgi:hypothetical protein